MGGLEGGTAVAFASGMGAALAVLAYFFDSCDIFEDPLVSAEAS